MEKKLVSTADARAAYQACQQLESTYIAHLETLRLHLGGAAEPLTAAAAQMVRALGICVLDMFFLSQGMHSVVQVADSRAPLAAAYTALLLAHATYADTKRVDQKLWQLYYRVIDIARDTRHMARDAILQVTYWSN